MGKCLASHRLRIMAVGLGLEAKKLRWLWRGVQEGSLSVAQAHSRLLPPRLPEGRAFPLPSGGNTWMLVDRAQAPQSILPTPPILSCQDELPVAFEPLPTHLSPTCPGGVSEPEFASQHPGYRAGPGW